MKHFVIGMLIGVASGLCTGAVVVAKNKKMSEKINNMVDSGEEKIKQFAKELKGKNKNQAEKDNTCPFVCN